jgi:hypothetical protein
MRDPLGGAASPMDTSKQPSRGAVYRRFFAGEIDVLQAVDELMALEPGWIEYFEGLTPEQETRLDELGAALGARLWEEMKRRHPSLPDVAYGSKEYHDFWRTAPPSIDDE